MRSIPDESDDDEDGEDSDIGGDDVEVAAAGVVQLTRALSW